MNEYDSIRRFIFIMISIIIGCLLITIGFDLNYLIKNRIYSIFNGSVQEVLFHIFIIYFLYDFIRDLTEEKGMFIEEKHVFTRYIAVRLVYQNI